MQKQKLKCGKILDVYVLFEVLPDSYKLLNFFSVPNQILLINFIAIKGVDLEIKRRYDKIFNSRKVLVII